MYEIQIEEDLIPEKTKDLLTFHVAEAPGNFITAIMHRFKTLNSNGDHHWFASSLNPKYSNEALPDSYGYIRRHPDRWLFGKDDTGNILNLENALNYKTILEEYKTKNNIKKIHLITGDLGVNIQINFKKQEDKITFLQKLELAQALSIIICSDEGSNCVVKHFMPYMSSHVITKKSIWYFISLLYIYRIHYDEFKIIKPFTSNRIGLEFYVTCKGFRQPKNSIVDNLGSTTKDLIEAFNKFKYNDSLFDPKSINQDFINEIDDFITSSISYYMDAVDQILELSGKR
jgi:cap2 methyltransferase